MSVPVYQGPIIENLKAALIKTLEALPSPEGCGCAERKRKMIAKLRAVGNA